MQYLSGEKAAVSIGIVLGAVLGIASWAVTPAMAQDECIVLTKIGPAQASPGEEVEYTFTVMNNCNYPLESGIQCYDELIGGMIWDSVLEIGQSATFTSKYMVTKDDCEQYIVNRAQCSGAPEIGSPVALSNIAEWQIFVDCDDCTPSGTGSPGYWKNHPEAWPMDEITIGGMVLNKGDAIEWMKTSVSKDKTLTLFKALVSAKLNVANCNEFGCIEETLVRADAWMATFGPVGSGVKASSAAWKMGEPLYMMLDKYNNGMLCAPHRD